MDIPSNEEMKLAGRILEVCQEVEANTRRYGGDFAVALNAMYPRLFGQLVRDYTILRTNRKAPMVGLTRYDVD